jgi:hypothetical protein
MDKKGKHIKNNLESRLHAVAAMRKVKGKRHIKDFIEALHDPDLAVAKTGLMGLRDRNAHMKPLTEMIQSTDPALRWKVCTFGWWFRMGEIVPLLIKALLHDPEPWIRAEAAWGLQSASTEDAAKALIRACKDRNRLTAYYAAFNLRVVAARHPELKCIKGKRISLPELLPERKTRSSCASEIESNANAFQQTAFSVPLPACRAPFAELSKPDGKLKKGYSEEGGHLQFIDGFPDTPMRKTSFRIACTNDALYLHIRCQYKGKKEISANAVSDGSQVFGDDCVEIFLDPSGKGKSPAFHIACNTANARAFLLSPSPHHHVWRPYGLYDEPWEPRNIQSCVKIEKGFWNAEVAIPFSDLGIKRGKVNKIWRMNIVRQASLKERLETTSWCNMGIRDAHQPSKFGYVWVDAGNIVNAPADTFQSTVMPLTPNLPGWKVLRGTCSVSEGTVTAKDKDTAIRWEQPIRFEQFEVAAEIQMIHQIRFRFAPDPDNGIMGFDGAYLRMINELHFAHTKNWRDWSPKLPGGLTIYKEVYYPLTHSRWYDARIRVLKDTCQLLLDNVIHIEMPKPAVDARYFVLNFAGGGKARKLRIQPL